MAINSFGYPNLVAAGDEFARWARHAAGRRYAVPGHTDFRVTAATSGTRRINIAAGYAEGQAVLVQNTATTTMDLPAPSGASQWFAIVIKRWVSDGSGGFVSELDYVAGNTTRAVPTLAATPGTNDDQALALVLVTSGSTLVVDVVDLRGIAYEAAAGFYVCHSDLAMNLLNMIGAEVYRTDNKTFYSRIATPAGVTSFKNHNDPETVLTGTDFTEGPAYPGWAQQSSQRLAADKKFVWVHIVVRKSGGQIVVPSTGSLGDNQNLVTLDAEWRPKVVVSAHAFVTSDAGVDRSAGGRISAAGLVQVTSAQAGATVRSVTVDAFYSYA